MLATDLRQRAEILRRWRNESAFAEHGFGDDRCHALGGHDALEHLFEVTFTVGPTETAPIEIAPVWNSVHIGNKGLESRFIRMRFAGQRKRKQRASVKCIVEADHRWALRVGASDLHGILDRFGARIQNQRLLCELARRQLIEPLGEFDVSLVWRHAEARMQIAIDLVANRRKNWFRPMPGIHAADAPGQINEGVPIDIFHQCAFRTRGEYRRGMEDAPRHGLYAPLHQFLRARTRNAWFVVECSACSQYQPIGCSFRLIWTCFVSRYSSMPHGPNSRPNPDCLYPPHGASTYVGCI